MNANQWFKHRTGIQIPPTHDIFKAEQFVEAGKEAAKPDGCITDALLKRNLLGIALKNDNIYNQCLHFGFLSESGVA